MGERLSGWEGERVGDIKIEKSEKESETECTVCEQASEVEREREREIKLIFFRNMAKA